MSGKSRHAIRMTSLLEKSHRVKIESIDDPTIINYLRLLEVILTPKPRKMSYYLTNLENRTEGDERMAEIDRLRELGCGTELDHEKWIEDFRRICKKNKEKSQGVRVKVINEYAGTEEEFSSIRKACEEYDLEYSNVRAYFTYKKSNEIKYKGLIIKKI